LRRKNTKENEREKLFSVKSKKSAQKVLDRPDVVRDARLIVHREGGLVLERYVGWSGKVESQAHE
jgi:hypothetical protein